MFIKYLLLILGAVGVANATTTIKVPEVSATQAIVWITTDQGGLGSCTIRASEGTSLGTNINDVNTTLFSGSNLDSRPGSLLVGGVHKFVLGHRDSPVSPSTNRRYSRALRNTTIHIIGVTCGGDAEVTKIFQTANPDTGVTFQDSRFDRDYPGQWRYPSMPWTTRGQEIIDHTSGVKLTLGTLPGDLMPFSQAQTFQSATPPTGWACSGSPQTCSYSGTSQNLLYLPSTQISTTSPTAPLPAIFGVPPGPIGSNADWAFASLTLSGTVGQATVFLTRNGVTPVGVGITKAITGSPTVYNFGDTTPVFEAWRSTPIPPIVPFDIIPQVSGVTKVGAVITWTSGKLFRSEDIITGSNVILGATTCSVASIQSDAQLTLSSSACVADGSYTQTVSNFGFLIQATTSASGTLAVGANPAWTLGSSGVAIMSASGEFTAVCSPVSTVGPGSVAGNLCAPFGGAGPPNQYLTAAPLYWIGVNGAVNIVGLTQCPTPTGIISGFVQNPVFDGLVGGRFYSMGVPTGGTHFNAIFQVDYTGPNTATTPGFNDSLDPAHTTSTNLTTGTNIDLKVAAFNSNFTAFNAASATPGWNLVQWVPNGTKGALLLYSLYNGQDSPAWFAVWSLDTSDIIAAFATYNGAGGAPNRWGAYHTAIGTQQYPYAEITSSTRTIGLSGNFTVSTTSNLVGPPWNTCPANSFGASGPNCSTITLGSLTPLDASGHTLLGQTILNGDNLIFESECARIVTLSGSTAVVWRNLQTVFVGCGGTTTHPVNVTATMGASGKSDQWWNFSTDPTGTALVVDAISLSGHYAYNLNTNIMGFTQLNTFLPGKPIRLGAVPGVITTQPFVVNWLAGFAGNNPPSTNCVQSHPSNSQFLASTYDQGHYLDSIPYFKCGSPTVGTVSAVGTQVYLVPASALSGYSYRNRQWVVSSGTHIAVDISAPNSVIHDTTADNYKYCVVLNAGECWPSSTAGQVYINFPFVSVLGSDPCAGATSTIQPRNDITIDEWGLATEGLMQGDTTEGWSPTGQSIRLISTMFSQVCTQSIFWNSRETSPGGQIWTTVDQLDGAQTQGMLVQLPPVPPQRSSNTNTFIPTTFKVAGVAGDQVSIHYGYAEYDQGQLVAGFTPPCMSRLEGCWSNNAGTTPFLWRSETQSPAPCSGACNVTINVAPAPGGRVVYYQVNRTNANGVASVEPVDVRLIR